MYLRVSATNSRSPFFDILLFSDFTAAEMPKIGDFRENTAIFNPKNPFLRISAAVKSEKSKILKKRLLMIVAETQRYIYTNFLTNWAIFHRLNAISFEKILQNFLRVSKKIAFFWPKIGQKLSKILEFNKNHLNTLPVQIWGHLKHI